jgi:hypothetical protein
MTLEEAQIAWLQADTAYKIYLANRVTTIITGTDKQVMKEEKELEVAFPELKNIGKKQKTPKREETDMPW